MNSMNKINKLDDIEKIDLIDDLLSNDVKLYSFINDIEDEEKKRVKLKRKIDIQNYIKFAVASLFAAIIWQSFLCDNSYIISSEIEKSTININTELNKAMNDIKKINIDIKQN